MKKQKKTPPLSRVLRHKPLVIASLVLVLLGAAVLAIRQAHYLSKLSDKDYSYLSSMMSGIVDQNGVTTVDKSQTCYYNNPYIFKNYLECYSEVVGYKRIDNEQAAEKSAQQFEAYIKGSGTVQGNLADFYAKPMNGIGSMLMVPHSDPKARCTVTIHTGTGPQTLSLDLPKRDLTGQIAFLMSCGGQSREAYFPMR